MNKDGKIIFLVVLLCFVLVNVCIQIQMSQGYNSRITIAGESAVGDVVDYDIGTRLIPISLTSILLLLVYFGMGDRNRSGVTKGKSRDEI